MAENSNAKRGPKPLPRRKERDKKLTKSVEVDTKTGPSEASQAITPDCPVCLQPSIHPVKLPCGHIFCFLCVKGAAHQHRRCALCRQAIPPSYFENPNLLGDIEASDGRATGVPSAERSAWFYEGREGWWQYDERTGRELEDGYRGEKRSFELLIAGYMYIIDLDGMVQMRRSDPSRRRHIKRDLVTAPKKGIAGLKIFKRDAEETEEVESSGEVAAEVGSSGEVGEAYKDDLGTQPGDARPTSSVQSGSGNDPPPDPSGAVVGLLAGELRCLSVSRSRGSPTEDNDRSGTALRDVESSDSGEVLEI